MPPVSHPFKQGDLIVLMNYNDHAPPHVHIKYQHDVRSYRLEIVHRLWMRPGKELPPTLSKGLKINSRFERERIAKLG